MATTLSTKIRRTLAAVLAALLLAFVVPSTTIAYVDLGTDQAVAAGWGKGHFKGDGLDGDHGSGNDRNGNSGNHFHNGGH